MNVPPSPRDIIRRIIRLTERATSFTRDYIAGARDPGYVEVFQDELESLIKILRSLESVSHEWSFELTRGLKSSLRSCHTDIVRLGLKLQKRTLLGEPSLENSTFPTRIQYHHVTFKALLGTYTSPLVTTQKFSASGFSSDSGSFEQITNNVFTSDSFYTGESSRGGEPRIGRYMPLIDDAAGAASRQNDMRASRLDRYKPRTSSTKATRTAPENDETKAQKLDRYKLKTTFHEGYVVHTTNETNLASKQRRVEVKTRWTYKRDIDKGGFGIVSLQEGDGGELRAVKKLSLVRDYSSELKTLAKLTDRIDLFVQFFGWYEDTAFLYIAMEYIELGDLSKYIKDPHTHLDAREITSQVLEGLVVLHERKICHRDLKPKNVLVACLDPIWVKIADFGISKREKDASLNTAIGTEGYTAPEIKLVRRSREYTNAVDLWSLGCLVHELLTSEVPFLGMPLVETSFSTDDFSGIALSNRPGRSNEPPQIDAGLLYDYCCGSREFPAEILQRSQVSNEGIDFVKKLLAANPRGRGTALEALRSPWLVERIREM